MYLKAEFLDAAYLQQDAYDPVDAASSLERQRHVFGLVSDILHATVNVRDKDGARAFFLELTQLFKTWNPMEFQSAEFNTMEQRIRTNLANALTTAPSRP
jgi:V/A-type H+-transporting ATPase subunit A